MTQGTVRLTRRRAHPEPVPPTRLQARLGAQFGSPIVLASSIVFLVGIVGIVSTLSTYRALRQSGERHESASIAARVQELRISLSGAFAVADAVVERVVPAALRPNAAAAPDDLLRTLTDVAFAPQGLTWASASYPDGTFVGVRREADDSLRGYVSRVSDRTETTYRIDANGVTVLGRSPTGYDPRQRSFYRAAIRSEGSIWTEPYPFLPDLHTGVTRATAVRREGEVRAVVTADFDATALAKLLGRPVTRSERALVAIGDVVLTTRGTRRPDAPSRSRTEPLRIADLDDPVIDASVRERSGRTEVEGEGYRISRESVGDLDGRPIELLIVVPERELFAVAVAEAKAGMLATAIVALFGLVLATLLSANVASLRRRRAEAEVAADDARREVEELGSYELGDRIGSGGMGEVYRATHRLLAREAAVKLIRFEPGDDVDGVMHRFFTEARTLAHLRSLHTVEVYDFGVSSDDRYFLAMELLHGLDLDTLVRIYGPQRPARVAAILAQICDSLAEVHAAGFVHQDIKPANVFLCHIAESLDFVKVLDFGLSRAIGRRPVAGENVEGTPAFMAPEQALGEEVTYATDLYAVGCVGYYLLAGRYPFTAKTADGYMRAHIELPIPPLPEPILATTPATLVQLVTRCLAKKPENRPMSATALANVLRRVVAEHAESFTESDLREFWHERLAIEEKARPHRRDSAARAPTERRVVVRATLG